MHKIWFDEAWIDYIYWQTQDKKTLKRINNLIKDTERNPFEGIGKPEPLKGNLSGFWSRHIDDTNYFNTYTKICCSSQLVLPILQTALAINAASPDFLPPRSYCQAFSTHSWHTDVLHHRFDPMHSRLPTNSAKSSNAPNSGDLLSFSMRDIAPAV